jgi:hypothetical protein
MTVDLQAALGFLPREQKVQAIYLLGRVLMEGAGILRATGPDPAYDPSVVSVVARLVKGLERETGLRINDMPEKDRRAVSEALDRLLRQNLPAAVDPDRVERELAALRKIAI